MRVAIVDSVSRKVENVIELPDKELATDDLAIIVGNGKEAQPDPENLAVVNGKFENGQWVLPENTSVIEAPVSIQDRLVNLEKEVRGMKERAANVSVTDPDAVKVKGAITGPPQE